MSTGTTTRANTANAARITAAAASHDTPAQAATRKQLAKQPYAAVRKQAHDQQKKTGHKPHGFSLNDLIDYLVRQSETASGAAHR